MGTGAFLNSANLANRSDPETRQETNQDMNRKTDRKTRQGMFRFRCLNEDQIIVRRIRSGVGRVAKICDGKIVHFDFNNFDFNNIDIVQTFRKIKMGPDVTGRGIVAGVTVKSCRSSSDSNCSCRPPPLLNFFVALHRLPLFKRLPKFLLMIVSEYQKISKFGIARRSSSNDSNGSENSFLS